jgi:putative transposase
MEQMRGHVYRLYPTPEQAATFRAWAGACRMIYNIALEQRRDWGRRYREREGKSLTGVAQQRDLKVLRAEHDWLASVPQDCLVAAIDDLDAAFDAFFRDLKKPPHQRRARYPKPAKRGQRDRFRFKRPTGIRIERLSARWGRVRLPKIGWIRLRLTRDLCGDLRSATVSLTPLGWQVSLMCRAEVTPPSPLPASVGIDRGVAVPLMLSTGEAFHLPPSISRLERRHKRAQRVASRRRKGSNRWKRAVRRAASLKAKQARVRAHWQHVVSRAIADRFGVVVIEKLQTAKMTKSAKGTTEKQGRNVKAKSGLNRVILNVGWHGFEVKLAYKLAERGGDLVRVDPAYTSQTCSACGHVSKESRKSQAAFECNSCGHKANADLNAAINIERRANGPSKAAMPPQDVEGPPSSGGGSGEASTCKAAA